MTGSGKRLAYTFLAMATCVVFFPSQAIGYEITIDRSSVGFGQEIGVQIVDTGPLSNCIELGEVSDDGENNLEIVFVQPDNCPPTVPVYPPFTVNVDLRAYFDLQPGVYNLTVEAKETTEQFQFEVFEDTFAIGPGMSGSWYDPDKSGQGFSIEVLPDQRLILYWYVYDNAGNALWLVGDGFYERSNAELELLRANENYFPPLFDPETVELERWGRLSIDFSDCRNGKASWVSDDASFEPGEMQINRLSPPNGLGCMDSVIESNGYTSDNLFADDDDLEFDVVVTNRNLDEVPTDWAVEMAELPGDIDEGRALRVEPGSNDNVVYVATPLAGVGRFIQIDNEQRGAYAFSTEVTLAIPAELACNSETSARFYVLLSSTLPNNAKSFQGVPTAGWVGGYHQVVDQGELVFIDPKTDCSSAGDPIVRTFRSSSELLIPQFPQYATLAVSVDSDETNVVFYAIDFRVALRGT